MKTTNTRDMLQFVKDHQGDWQDRKGGIWTIKMLDDTGEKFIYGWILEDGVSKEPSRGSQSLGWAYMTLYDLALPTSEFTYLGTEEKPTTARLRTLHLTDHERARNFVRWCEK